MWTTLILACFVRVQMHAVRLENKVCFENLHERVGKLIDSLL